MKLKLFIWRRSQLLTVFLVVCIFGMMGCEGEFGGEGHVYSAKTMLPLANTEVTLILNGNRMNTSITDSTGLFSAIKFGGCVPRCPAAQIEFKRNGYATLIVSMDSLSEKNPQFNSDSLIIKLVEL
jgi:hypothetical protein